MAVALFVCGDGMAEELYSLVSEFGKDHSEHIFADGLSADSFKDPDEPAYRPMFVTLPILRIGGKSRNGFQWGKDEVQHVVQEINQKRVEGNLGHTPMEKRSTDYKLPVLRWVGATLKEDGTAWATAYVPRYASDVLDYFKDAKRARARVGTSVYGLRGAQGLRDMTLESIDVGHPDRLGLPDAAAVPHVSEMAHNPGGSSMEDESKIVSELLASRDEAKALVSELQTQVKDKDAQITTLTTQAAQLSVIAEMANGQDVVTWVNGLVSELATVKREQRKAQRHDTAAAKVPDTLKPEARKRLVNLILVNVGEDVPDDKFETAVAEYMQSEDYQFFSKSVVSEMAGPAAVRSGSGKPSEIVIDDDFIARARQFAGI